VIKSELARMGVLISGACGSIMSFLSTYVSKRYLSHLKSSEREIDRRKRRTSASVPPSRYPSPGTSNVKVHDNF